VEDKTVGVKIPGAKHSTLSASIKDGDGNTFLAVVQNPAHERGVIVYRIASGRTVGDVPNSVKVVWEPKRETGNPSVATFLIDLNVRRDGWGELATWSNDQDTYEVWEIKENRGWTRKVSDGNLLPPSYTFVDDFSRTQIAELRVQIGILTQQINDLEGQLDRVAEVLSGEG
jgi:hypothetical protein